MNNEVKTINGYAIKDETARNSINNINTEYPYYKGITTVKERYYDTDCYITTIPKYDENNELIDLYIGYDETKTPLEYAQDENTNLTINASLYLRSNGYGNGVPSIISNGEIIRENDILGGLPQNILYVGIKANREFVEYPVISTTASQMLADGCLQVFDVFWKLVENGEAVDLTNVTRDDGVNADAVQGPRQTLGVKANGDIVILTCDGRTESNIGLYSHEQQEIMIEKGCITAWNLDGGGSTSTVIKGVKINRNIDENGTKDRYIPYTLNVKKQTTLNPVIPDTFSEIGKTKQEVIRQIIDDSQDRKIGCQILVDSYTVSTDTYSPMHLGTKYGNEYSKENVILVKENEEDTIYTKFKINKKGYFKVTTYVGFTSRTGPSAKYLKTRRITNNYDLPGSTINCASILESAQRMFISNQAYIRVRSVDEEFSIMFSGDINDAVTQGSIIIEEI